MSMGKSFIYTFASFLLVHSIAKLAYDTKKEVCSFLLTQKPAPLNYKHHPNVLRLQSTHAGLQELLCEACLAALT